jgi:MFS family permease
VSSFAHANVRFGPPRWHAYVFTTIETHSLHHQVGFNETRCNYANALILLDHLLTYAQATLHMSARSGFISGIVTNAIAIPTAMLGGWLSDRHGRRHVDVWGNLRFLLLIYPVFAWIMAARSEVVLFTAMTALSVAFGTVFVISIAAFGGTTQLVLTGLSHVTGRAMAPAWYLIRATAIAQVSFMLIPESAPSQVRPPPATAYG